MLKSRGGREENEKLLLSVKETCGLTGLSERTVRTLMAENDFTVRIGRRTLVHKKKFEKWLEKQETCCQGRHQTVESNVGRDST